MATPAGGGPQYMNPLELPTFDGGSSSVHPSVLFILDGWNGAQYWMAFTPWPTGAREQPSILCSHDGINWHIPEGLTNPIMTQAEVNTHGFGYAADPELVMLPDGRLACYFMMIGGVQNFGSIAVMYSSDGSIWSDLTYCLEDGVHQAIVGSPSIIVEEDGSFSLIGNYLSTSSYDTLTSTDGVDWTGRTSINFPAAHADWEQNHCHWVKAGGYYHLLVMTTILTEKQGLYYLRSSDKINWEGDLFEPSVPRSGEWWDERDHYRSALVPRHGESGLAFDIYVSGLPISALGGSGNGGYRSWRIGLLKNVTLELDHRDSASNENETLRLIEQNWQVPMDHDRWEGSENGTGNNNASLANVAGFYQSTGSTTGSWALLKSGKTGPKQLYPYMLKTQQYDTMDFGVERRLRVAFVIFSSDSESVFRFKFGCGHGSETSPFDPSLEGFGFKIENLQLKVMAHTGATLNISGSLATIQASKINVVDLVCDGAGLIKLYLNGGYVGSVVGPSGLRQYAINMSISATNGAGTNDSNWTVGALDVLTID